MEGRGTRAASERYLSGVRAAPERYEARGNLP